MTPEQAENAARLGHFLGMAISVLIGTMIIVALIGATLWVCRKTVRM